MYIFGRVLGLWRGEEGRGGEIGFSVDFDFDFCFDFILIIDMF